MHYRNPGRQGVLIFDRPEFLKAGMDPGPVEFKAYIVSGTLKKKQNDEYKIKYGR